MKAATFKHAMKTQGQMTKFIQLRMEPEVDGAVRAMRVARFYHVAQVHGLGKAARSGKRLTKTAQWALETS